MDKNSYKKTVSEIKAPEALIRQTLDKIDEKQNRKRKHVALPWAVAAAACAVVLIGGMVISGQNSADFAQLPPMASQMDFGQIEMLRQPWTVEEYEDFTGLDIPAQPLASSDIYASYGSGGQVESVAAELSYTDGTAVTIETDKTHSPDKYMQAQSKEIAGKQIWFSEQPDTAKYHAYFECDGHSYLISAQTNDRQDFVKLVKDLVRR